MLHIQTKEEETTHADTDRTHIDYDPEPVLQMVQRTPSIKIVCREQEMHYAIGQSHRGVADPVLNINVKVARRLLTTQSKSAHCL